MDGSLTMTLSSPRQTVRIPEKVRTVQLCREAKTMRNSNLRLVPPTKEMRTVMPTRRPNSELRPREHLTEREVEKLIEAAKANRHGHRDATMILIGFRHGLRASDCNGQTWNFKPRPFIFAGPKVEQRLRIHCWVMNCGRCGH
jgi:integrase